MEPPNESAVRQPGHRTSRKSKPPRNPQPAPYGGYPPQQNPPLFDDTSAPHAYGGQYPGPGAGAGYGYPMQGMQGFGAQMLQDPQFASMAVNYGQTLMGQGKDMVDEKMKQYVSISKLKYYFAVDTNYVMKKLALLLFPFTHSDWSVHYNSDEPVAPRYEINAPDLYIPAMAFVTYVLLTGYVYGTQNRFSPEQLGMQASSALVWLIIEILAILFTVYVMRMDSQLRTWDLLAFCSYKYVGMIVSLLAGLPLGLFGYICALGYSSISLGFFLVRTLRLQLLPEKENDVYEHGSKRRLYLLLFIAVLQPIMMYWLTYRVTAAPPDIVAER